MGLSASGLKGFSKSQDNLTKFGSVVDLSQHFNDPSEFVQGGRERERERERKSLHMLAYLHDIQNWSTRLSLSIYIQELFC